MFDRSMALGAALLFGAVPATAQPFTQALVFGDSTVDSGFYRALPNPGGGANFNALWPAAVAAGAGVPTTSPGLMNSQVLAARFGLTANPANQPGGTNFATSGAKNVLVNNNVTGGFQAAIPTATQIANYLAGSGGRANSNGLYLIHSGGNDVEFAVSGGGSQTAVNAIVRTAADGLTTAIGSLSRAGARTIIVPGLNFSFPGNDPVEREARLVYTQTLWWGLASAGINFIPADFNAVRLAIAANPAAFGFEFIGTGAGQTACTKPAGINSAWSLLCSSSPGAPSQLAAPNADQTRLFADDTHMTTAGQKIEADYYYSLIVAPAQISLLAENAVVARLGTVAGIQQQIDITRRRPSVGYNVWINGDVASLRIGDPAPGFGGDRSTPFSGSVGIDYKWESGVLAGAAFTMGTQSAAFDLGGGFKQKEFAGSLYAGYTAGPVWTNVIGSYGTLHYDVNRIVPIGITRQDNTGVTNGANLSLAMQGGADFKAGIVTHGPIAGLVLQRVKVDGFTEAGSFTSLGFDQQVRESAVSALGYGASVELGAFRPFAQLVWNHELAPNDRTIRTSLTTVVAPSWEAPAARLGSDWGTAVLGTTFSFGNGFTGLASATGQLGQGGVATYGGRLGLNYAFR